MTGTQDDETWRIVEDTLSMLTSLSSRAVEAENAGDIVTIKWLHKRVTSIERDAQKREPTPEYADRPAPGRERS